MKVLIAEDDPMYCRILESVLREEYEVVLAQDGSRAWEILQEKNAPSWHCSTGRCLDLRA